MQSHYGPKERNKENDARRSTDLRQDHDLKLSQDQDQEMGTNWVKPIVPVRVCFSYGDVKIPPLL